MHYCLRTRLLRFCWKEKADEEFPDAEALLKKNILPHLHDDEGKVSDDVPYVLRYPAWYSDTAKEFVRKLRTCPSVPVKYREMKVLVFFCHLCFGENLSVCAQEGDDEDPKDMNSLPPPKKGVKEWMLRRP